MTCAEEQISCISAYFMHLQLSDTQFVFFMPPKELRWHIKIEPSVRLSAVSPSVTNRVSAISHKLLKQI